MEGSVKGWTDYLGFRIAGDALAALGSHPPPAGADVIRTRVCRPPRAFLIQSASCTMLTQHLTSRDSNSARILVPFQLPLGARGTSSLKSRDSRETFREKLGLGLQIARYEK
jgi:hypothetical protein